MPASAYLGSAYRRGLPPGVYERRPVVAASAEVRMDVAAFVGLAERGPLDEAVAIESFAAYLARFGAPGGGRLLGQAVYLFFANGGRRCVVARAAGPDARAAVWSLPVLLAGGYPLRIHARDPGAWGNRLQGQLRFVLRPAPATPLGPPSSPKVSLPDPAVVVGATLRYVRRPDPLTLEEGFVEVVAVERAGDGTRVVTLAGLPAGLTPEALAALLGALREVRIELTLATPELGERFTDLGLSPAHPRYLPRVLEGDDGGPLGDGSHLARARARRGAYRPAPEVLLGTDRSRAATFAWSGAPGRAGNDGAETTERRGFFQATGNRAAPLDLLDAYDEENETQPVSLLNLPDLVHPRQIESAEDVPIAAPADALRFGPCTAALAIRGELPPVDYPRLAISGAGDLTEVRTWQARLVELCSALAPQDSAGGPTWWGRVAILDLPPGLAAADVLAWRRAVRADSGTAALYAPYLRSAPAEDPLAPLMTVPPGGVACGIIARRERRRGVFVAPANEPVQAVVAPFDDGQLPDAGFLHEERVNAIRATERGLFLLGARTTSDDPDWTHLSVRRLLHWLERQIVIDTRWAVFEPDDRILWSRLVRGVERRLERVLAAGGLAGRSPAEAFFVRCDATLNGAAAAGPGEGRVIVEVGVAPAVPAEFIVFELAQHVDGSSLVEERRA